MCVKFEFNNILLHTKIDSVSTNTDCMWSVCITKHILLCIYINTWEVVRIILAP